MNAIETTSKDNKYNGGETGGLCNRDWRVE